MRQVFSFIPGPRRLVGGPDTGVFFQVSLGPGENRACIAGLRVDELPELLLLGVDRLAESRLLFLIGRARERRKLHARVECLEVEAGPSLA